MAKKPKNIVCIEESANDNGFLSKSAKEHKRELRVLSVEHMVDKVLRRLRSRSIQTLCIIGHGVPGYQSVGNGTMVLHNGNSLALRHDAFALHGDAESQLERLQGRFAPNGKLVLGGCRVAAEDKGKGLLMRISALLDNIAVEASESKQYPPLGMEGIVVRAVGKTVCTVNAQGVCADDDDDQA